MNERRNDMNERKEKGRVGKDKDGTRNQGRKEKTREANEGSKESKARKQRKRSQQAGDSLNGL